MPPTLSLALRDHILKVFLTKGEGGDQPKGWNLETDLNSKNNNRPARDSHGLLVVSVAFVPAVK